MASAIRKFGDENSIGYRNSRAPATQRVTEGTTWDEPDEANESDE